MVLEKNGCKIEFGWEYMEDGEIKCNDKTFAFLETLVKHKFEYGKGEVLNLKMKAFIKPLSYPTRLISDKDKMMNDFFYFKPQE
jgi:hypothetical protein